MNVTVCYVVRHLMTAGRDLAITVCDGVFTPALTHASLSSLDWLWQYCEGRHLILSLIRHTPS